MTVDVFSAFLSYITIPIYVFGLLFLVYIIARSQLGFSITGQMKQSVKSGLSNSRQKGLKRLKGQNRSGMPIITYLIVFSLFALFTVMTIIRQRKQSL